MHKTITLALTALGLTIAAATAAVAHTAPIEPSKLSTAQAMPSFSKQLSQPRAIILARACNCPCPPEYCG